MLPGVLIVGAVSADDFVNYIPLPDINEGNLVMDHYAISPPGRAPRRHTQTNFKPGQMLLAWALAADSLQGLYDLKDAIVEAVLETDATVTIGLTTETARTYAIYPPDEIPELIQGQPDSTLTTFQFFCPRWEIRPYRWAFAESGSS